MGNNQKTILLVEDEAITSHVTSKILKQFGYKVVTADSGEKAVEITLNNKDINLILMDIDLGRGIDGTEAAVAILQNHDIPVVFHSSHTEPEIVEKTEKITSYGYVVKNSGVTVLDASIKMAFKLFQAHKSLSNELAVRKKVEGDLRLKSLVLDQIKDHVTITDLKGIITYVNQMQAEMLGRPKEKLSGKTTDIYGEDANKGSTQKEIVEKTLQNGEWRGEVINYGIDGSEHIMDCRTNVIYDDNNSAIALCGIATDITERKQMEGYLLESEEKYRLLHENAGIGIGYYKPDGTVISYNRLASKHMGGTPEDFIGRSIYDIFPEQEAEFYYNRIQNAVLSPDPVIYNDFVQLPSGDKYFISTFTRIINKFNDIIGVQVISQDITGQKRMEEALRDSEERFRMIYENAPVMIDAFDVNGRCVLWNATCEQTFGWRIDEINSAPEPLALFYPDPEIRARVIESVTTNPESIFHEWHPYTKHGKRLTCMWANYILPDGIIMNIGYDITEKKQTEEALRKREELFKSIVHNSANLTVLTDAQGVATYVSPQCESVLGYAAGKFMGQLFPDIIHPEDLTRCKEKWLEVKNGGSLQEYEYRIIDGNGDIRWVSHSARLVIADGQVIGQQNTIRDISTNKRAEEMLLASKKQLNHITDNIPGFVTYVNAQDFRFKFVNRMYANVFGKSPNELIGKQVKDIMPVSAYEYSLPYFERVRAGERVHYENMVSIHGESRWLSIDYIPELDEQGRVGNILALAYDITERRQTEEQIKILLAEKELILKEVHHRLKNNLNTVYGLLKLQAGNINDSRAISILEDSANRVQSMMVLYDKLYHSSDVQNISVKDYLPNLIDEITANFHNSKSVQIEKKIEDFMLAAKRLQPLGMIINELLTNIMKYAFKGREKGIINVSAEAEGTRVSIVIGDNGLGLPETVNFENSAGFGLQLVAMLTKELHGTINIERGNGTKFILKFEI